MAFASATGDYSACRRKLQKCVEFLLWKREKRPPIRLEPATVLFGGRVTWSGASLRCGQAISRRIRSRHPCCNQSHSRSPCRIRSSEHSSSGNGGTCHAGDRTTGDGSTDRSRARSSSPQHNRSSARTGRHSLARSRCRRSSSHDYGGTIGPTSSNAACSRARSRSARNRWGHNSSAHNRNHHSRTDRHWRCRRCRQQRRRPGTGPPAQKNGSSLTLLENWGEGYTCVRARSWPGGGRPSTTGIRASQPHPRSHSAETLGTLYRLSSS
jgi:hypothetical protein